MVAVVFVVLLAGVLIWLGKLAFTDAAWLDASGLRGPLFLAGGLVAFALTVRGVGLAVATPLLAFISGLASSETRFVELVIFTVFMTALCIFVFKFMLNLPMPVFTIPGVIYI